MKLTVYEDNKSDKPLKVTATEVADKVQESNLEGHPLGVQVNLTLAKHFGSFDPRTKEYRDFEDAVVNELLNRTQT